MIKIGKEYLEDEIGSENRGACLKGKYRINGLNMDDDLTITNLRKIQDLINMQTFTFFKR